MSEDVGFYHLWRRLQIPSVAEALIGLGLVIHRFVDSYDGNFSRFTHMCQYSDFKLKKLV